MTSTPNRKTTRPRAAAARQALRLYEAALIPSASTTHGGQPRATAVTARAALRAAGLPPHLAAALRRRLRVLPDNERTPPP